MKMTASTSARLCTTGLAVCALIASQVALAQAPAPVAQGPLAVHVTSAGAPAVNATVCIGVPGNLNLHGQGTTDAQGNVRFSEVPSPPFVATANQAGRGAQRSIAPASPNVPVPPQVPLLRIDLALPASGGPTCPSTAAGPARTLGPQIRQQLPPLIGPTRPPSITPARTEFCFGAIGMQCGQPQTGLPTTAACASGNCFINGGSWEHDECCYRNRHSLWCELDPARQIEAASMTMCVNTWNKAVRLTTKGLSWRRPVDFARGNRSGTVEFALYCAPANTLLPPDDANKCCSGQTRDLSAPERAYADSIFETLRACR